MDKICLKLLQFTLAIIFIACGNSGSSNNEIEIQEKDVSFDCALCGGTGYYGGYNCGRCGGEGVEYSTMSNTGSSNISFGSGAFYYGPCNGGCGCQIYKHEAGKDACINCDLFNCNTNKHGHQKIYK